MQVLNSDFEPGDGGGVGQGDLLEGAGYHCHRSGHKCYSRYLDQVQYFFKTQSKQKVKVWGIKISVHFVLCCLEPNPLPRVPGLTWLSAGQLDGMNDEVRSHLNVN